MVTAIYKQRGQICQNLKARCPLPQLLHRLGLGNYARPSCRSPLRNDQSSSWGIYERSGKHYWKDFGNSDGGDEITFIARLKGWDVKKHFGRILEYYQSVADGPTAGITSPPVLKSCQRSPTPTCLHLLPGTPEPIAGLSRLRGISVEALKMASQRGFLVFGHQIGHEVFGLKDQSGKLVEVRRLDGQLFPAFASLNTRKSHTLAGSIKSWPLGIEESEGKPGIALVEGGPDFLACFDFIMRENKSELVAPVAMMSASVKITPEALERFSGKHVRIYPHNDPPGMEAALNWTQQLIGIASIIDYYQFRLFEGIKDLADLNLLATDPDRSNQLTSEVLS